MPRSHRLRYIVLHWQLSYYNFQLWEMRHDGRFGVMSCFVRNILTLTHYAWSSPKYTCVCWFKLIFLLIILIVEQLTVYKRLRRLPESLFVHNDCKHYFKFGPRLLLLHEISEACLHLGSSYRSSSLLYTNVRRYLQHLHDPSLHREEGTWYTRRFMQDDAFTRHTICGKYDREDILEKWRSLGRRRWPRQAGQVVFMSRLWSDATIRCGCCMGAWTRNPEWVRGWKSRFCRWWSREEIFGGRSGTCQDTGRSFSCYARPLQQSLWFLVLMSRWTAGCW